MTASAIFYGSAAVFWVAGPVLAWDAVRLQIGDGAQPVLFLTDLGDGPWQANSRPPAGLKPGPQAVRVRSLYSAFSDPAEVLFQP